MRGSPNFWGRGGRGHARIPSGSKLRTSCSSTLRLLGFVLVAAGRTLPLGAQEAAARPLPAENVPEQGHPLLDVIREEAHRYVSDTFHILGSPLRWSGSEWERAGVVLAGIGVLLREDERIDAAFQRNRSRSTDSFSSAVTPFGSYVAVGISAGALGGGLLLRNTPLRETGRDAIEAELIAAGIVTPLLKSVVGRLRPAQGSDADEFHVFSRNQSFPSGHSTEAFAVASVFAARSSGWLVPAVSYRWRAVSPSRE